MSSYFNWCQEITEGRSRFLSHDMDGETCRLWAQVNPHQADTAKQSFCVLNPLAEECKCVNRHESQLYRSIKPNKNKDQVCDGSWWIPCSDPQNYLVTTEDAKYLTNDSTKLNKRCGNICSVIKRNFFKQSVYTAADAELYTNCALDDNGSTFWQRYRGWIIATIVVILLIIILFFIVIWLRSATRTSRNAT